MQQPTPMRLDDLPVMEIMELFRWQERTILGSGSYADVYRAERIADQKDYAVKVIHKDRVRDARQWRQLAHEIIIQQHLDHPGCVKCVDAFQSETDVYIIQEHVGGGELFNVIKSRGRLTEEDTARIVTEILTTLVYMHDTKGVVHRDLKPENLLCTTNDLSTLRIKIIDFGFAKFFGRIEEGMGLSGQLSPNDGIRVGLPAGAILNTPKGSLKYLAPEIIQHIIKHRSNPRVTTRPEIQKVDIYAVGVVMYVMLCGRFPFRGQDKDTILRHVDHGLSFSDPNWLTVSQDAKDFCAWLLNPEAARRPLASVALKHHWLSGNAPPTPLQSIQPSDLCDADREEIKAGMDIIRRQESDLDRPYQPTTQQVQQMVSVETIVPQSEVGIAGTGGVLPTRSDASGAKVTLNLRKKKPPPTAP